MPIIETKEIFLSDWDSFKEEFIKGFLERTGLDFDCCETKQLNLDNDGLFFTIYSLMDRYERKSVRIKFIRRNKIKPKGV
jgi:hypothetical protein